MEILIARMALLPVLVLALSLFALPVAAQDDIGVAGAVVNQVSGEYEGQVRTLRVGASVVRNEVIRTARRSATQLIFLDETTLAIGPDSEIVLDTLIYDPGSAVGRFVIRAISGVIRFTSGNLPAETYVVQTPVSTIGVRGTIFDLVVEKETGATTVVLVDGAIVVASLDGPTLVLDVPGLSTTISARGAVPTPPAPPPPSVVERIRGITEPEESEEAAFVAEPEEDLATLESDTGATPIDIQQVIEFTDDLGLAQGTHGTH